MSRWRWQALQAWRELGLPGWVGLVLLLITALVWAGVLKPLEAQIESLQAQQSAALARLGPQDRAPASLAPAGSLPAQLAAFEQGFPGEAGIAPALAKLHASAMRHGVQFESGVFRLDKREGEALARYTLDWPVKADYLAVRRFVAEVLREQPAMALEAMQLQREDPSARGVTAKLRWVLFVNRAA